MRRSIAFTIALLALPRAAYAQTQQPSLTLAAAVARSQSDSFMVRLSEADENAAAARALGARALLLPTIGVSGTTVRGGISQLGMPAAQQTYALGSASVPLFVPSTIASATAASRGARASSFDVMAARSDAAYVTTQAYERSLLAEAIVSSRLSTVSYQQRRATDVDLRVSAGAAPRYQRAQAQAALAEASQMLEDARADRDKAVADLEVLLDLPISRSMQLADSLSPVIFALDEATCQRKAMLQRPEILSAEQQVQSADVKLAAARDAYLPNVVGAAQAYSGHSKPDLGARAYSVGVTATLPLIDGGTRTAAFAEAKADVARARILLDQAKRSAQRDVANAGREYEAAHHGLDLANVEATAASEELRIAILRERNGKGIALETLAAIADDAAARENVLKATARFNVAIAGLYHAAGDVYVPISQQRMKRN